MTFRNQLKFDIFVVVTFVELLIELTFCVCVCVCVAFNVTSFKLILNSKYSFFTNKFMNILCAVKNSSCQNLLCSLVNVVVLFVSFLFCELHISWVVVLTVNQSLYIYIYVYIHTYIHIYTCIIHNILHFRMACTFQFCYILLFCYFI